MAFRLTAVDVVAIGRFFRYVGDLFKTRLRSVCVSDEFGVFMRVSP